MANGKRAEVTAESVAAALDKDKLDAAKAAVAGLPETSEQPQPGAPVVPEGAGAPSLDAPLETKAVKPGPTVIRITADVVRIASRDGMLRFKKGKVLARDLYPGVFDYVVANHKTDYVDVSPAAA